MKILKKEEHIHQTKYNSQKPQMKLMFSTYSFMFELIILSTYNQWKFKLRCLYDAYFWLIEINIFRFSLNHIQA